MEEAGQFYRECDLMVKAAQRYNRVVQVGQWQRSDPPGTRGAATERATGRYVREGMGSQTSMDVADRLIQLLHRSDYDMWLGPAPERPFNQTGSIIISVRWDYAEG